MTYTTDYGTLAAESSVGFDEPATQAPIGLDQVHSEFNLETIDAGLHFGEDHSAFTAQFIVALATKPFVILSGLSGSGKTLLATTFGQWLGRDQLLLQPVRPDWTSPEALLGREDRNSESYDSQYGWCVPRSLDFILRAAHDPQHPYVLVLDEMNLAHVERYFADVLSGMESGQPMVPNLQRDPLGWRMPPREAEYIPWPKNLFTVGTINVDETTYAFSPKVLDRASVVEFRVSSDSICMDYPKQRPIRRADSVIASAFLERALGDEVQWPGREGIYSAMQSVHQILFKHGAEFGHRVVRESVRFASMMGEVGLTDMPTILDHILVQRILPKLEIPGVMTAGLLQDLAGFAATGSTVRSGADALVGDAKPLLPKTMSKLRRLSAIV